MPLRTADVFRNDIVTVPELLSDGYGENSIYFDTALVSTSVSQVVTVVLTPGGSPGNDVSLLYEGDIQVNSGDILFLYGTQPGNIADGYYTVDTVLSDTTLSVRESLANSTDGYIQFRYTVGARSVGFDPTDTTFITATNVQDAITQLDGYVSESSCDLTPAEHEIIRQLIHLADGVGGPFEGFLSGSYRTVTYSPTMVTPTYICWWTSSAQVAKIADKTVSYNGVLQPEIISWNAYNTDGVSILATVTDTVTYNVIFETSRTRTIVNYNGICDICCITVDNHASLRQLIHLADGVGGPVRRFCVRHLSRNILSNK